MTTLKSEVSTTVKVQPYSGTNIGGYVFDAFLRVDHQSRLEITKHPVQTGANIADHSYVQPQKLEFDIGMTDVAKKSKYQSQFDSGSSRSVTAYKILKELQNARTPVKVTTRLGVFNNMVVSEVHAPDDYTTLYGLKATVTMEEVFLASVGTYKISSNANKTDTTNRGTISGSEFSGSGVTGSW